MAGSSGIRAPLSPLFHHHQRGLADAALAILDESPPIAGVLGVFGRELVGLVCFQDSALRGRRYILVYYAVLATPAAVPLVAANSSARATAATSSIVESSSRLSVSMSRLNTAAAGLA